MSFLPTSGFDLVLNCNYLFSRFLTLKQFLLLGVFVLVSYIYFSFPYLVKRKIGVISLVFVVVGALLNNVERLTGGCVKDYFSFFNLFHFNVADLLMDTGILLSVYILCKKK
jgi:lipoprotein signal peptidase